MLKTDTRAREATNPDKTNLSPTFFCDHYYDGVSNVQSCMAAAITAARKEQAMKNEILDDLCGYGGDRPLGTLPLPKSAAFENDPRQVNSLVFTLASAALGITVETAMRKRLTREQKNEVASYIEANQLGVMASGSLGSTKIMPIDRAEMFAQTKAFSEVDWSVMQGFKTK